MKLKHKYFYKLKSNKSIFSDDQGSAIVFVIVFITIVLFFISIVLLYNHYQYMSIINYGNDIQTYYNARSAVLLTLERQNLDKQKWDYQYRQFKYHLSNSDTTIVSVEPYGMYSKYQSISKIKKSKSERTFIIGRESDDRFQKALVIGDTRNPVIVSGKTSITGDVLVGPQGVKPGVIRGIGFKGERIVDGNIEKDTKSSLPSIYIQSLFEQISRLQNITGMDYNRLSIKGKKLYLDNQNLNLNQDALESLRDEGIDFIIGPGKIICYDNIEISDLNILNQVTIYSDSSISISGNSTSKNILVFANRIFISGPVQLSGQFFAQYHLEIINAAQIKYPSVIGLISNQFWPDNTLLKIGQNAEVNGFVFIHNFTDANRISKYMLNVDESAVINGITYSDMYTELRGMINGSVLTDAFYLYERPTIYINWLKDAMINRTVLNDNIILPLSYDINTDYVIAQEL